MRVFGCKTFTHISDEKRDKLESKTIPCVFLSYCEGTKTYCLMCVKPKGPSSQDVVFLERTEEVKGVHDHRPLLNQVKHVVVDELVKDVNPISLKE